MLGPLRSRRTDRPVTGISFGVFPWDILRHDIDYVLVYIHIYCSYLLDLMGWKDEVPEDVIGFSKKLDPGTKPPRQSTGNANCERNPFMACW